MMSARARPPEGKRVASDGVTSDEWGILGKGNQANYFSLGCFVKNPVGFLKAV
jgi:hypothetical protein